MLFEEKDADTGECTIFIEPLSEPVDPSHVVFEDDYVKIREFMSKNDTIEFWNQNQQLVNAIKTKGFKTNLCLFTFIKYDWETKSIEYVDNFKFKLFGNFLMEKIVDIANTGLYVDYGLCMSIIDAYLACGGCIDNNQALFDYVVKSENIELTKLFYGFLNVSYEKKPIPVPNNLSVLENSYKEQCVYFNGLMINLIHAMRTGDIVKFYEYFVTYDEEHLSTFGSASLELRRDDMYILFELSLELKLNEIQSMLQARDDIYPIDRRFLLPSHLTKDELLLVCSFFVFDEGD